jgi:hypothetical protein
MHLYVRYQEHCILLLVVYVTSVRSTERHIILCERCFLLRISRDGRDELGSTILVLSSRERINRPSADLLPIAGFIDFRNFAYTWTAGQTGFCIVVVVVISILGAPKNPK